MINEYALEPSLLNNWKDFRYFVEKFGIENGRLISRYPSKWKKMVYESLPNDLSVIGRKRIEEALNQIDDKLLPRENTWDANRDWLINAEEEHGRLQFHAIVAEDKSWCHPRLMTAPLSSRPFATEH